MLKILKALLLLYLVSLTVGCKPSVSTDWVMFQSEESRLDYNIYLDTLWISPPNILGRGDFYIHGDKIVYADTQKAKLNYFDDSGNLVKEALGLGDGPDKVRGLEYFIPIDNEAFFIVSTFLTYYFPSVDGWTSYSLMDFRGEKSPEELIRKPQADDWELYQPNWLKMHINFFSQQDSILYFPIITEHPKLNAFQHKRFYRETKTIAKLDALTGKLMAIGGEWPNIYLDQAFIPNLAAADIFVYQGNIFASFLADPSIYVYDLNFNPQFKFGKATSKVDARFQRYTGGWDAVDAWDYDLRVNPLYASIYVDDEYIFRVAYPQGMEQNGVLQIYNQKDFSLIAEVDVPYRFKVIGKIGDFYVADGIVDDKREKVGVFKFSVL